MKIVQVLTLLTRDNAYGGPATVALNQARALRQLGHDVVLAAGCRGYSGSPPTERDGVPLKLFPANQRVPIRGFAGVAAPALSRWLTTHLRSTDVVHVHLARDLITMPAARIAVSRGVPLVLQTHGMIAPSGRLLALPVDRLMTRPILSRASSVLYLTDRERRELLRVARTNLELSHLPNGVPVSQPSNGERTHRDVLNVLFLARLQERKRPELFARIARRLAETHPHCTFSIVGPDEGSLSSVHAAWYGAPNIDQLLYEGSLEPQNVGDRFDSCDIYVLPSIDEPFPMTALEAMAHGKPVVVTDSCGLAPSIEATRSGIVVNDTEDALFQALERLINDEPLRREMGANARSTSRELYAMEAVAKRLESVYIEAIRRGRSRAAD